MMRPADFAIAWPLGRLHQFESADPEGLSSIWGTGGSPMVPNQDYTEDGEESSSTKFSRGLLPCEQCVAGRNDARATLPMTAIQVICGEQPTFVRLMGPGNHLPDTAFYDQGFDSLIYRYENCLNRHGDY
jgi:hypothetical protein